MGKKENKFDLPDASRSANLVESLKNSVRKIYDVLRPPAPDPLIVFNQLVAMGRAIEADDPLG